MDVSNLVRELQLALVFYRQHFRALLLTAALAAVPMLFVQLGMKLYLSANRSELRSELHEFRERAASQRASQSDKVHRLMGARSRAAAHVGVRGSIAQAASSERRARGLLHLATAEFSRSLWTAAVMIPLTLLVATFGIAALVAQLRRLAGGGAPLAVREAWAVALRHTPALGWTGLVTGGVVLAGCAAFLVPGLVVLYLGALVVPVTMLEGRSGWGAFRRSAELMLHAGPDAWGAFALCAVVEFGTSVLSATLLPEQLEIFGSTLGRFAVLPLTATFLLGAYDRMTQRSGIWGPEL